MVENNADEKSCDERDTIDQRFEEHLESIKSPAERQSLLELTRNLARLPLEKSAAALESAAAIAGVSLRAAIEFLRAAPGAANAFEAAELRSWCELGRRLAMGDVETAVSFFVVGVEDFQLLSSELRQSIFQ